MPDLLPCITCATSRSFVRRTVVTCAHCITSRQSRPRLGLWWIHPTHPTDPVQLRVFHPNRSQYTLFSISLPADKNEFLILRRKQCTSNYSYKNLPNQNLPLSFGRVVLAYKNVRSSVLFERIDTGKKN